MGFLVYSVFLFFVCFFVLFFFLTVFYQQQEKNCRTFVVPKCWKVLLALAFSFTNWSRTRKRVGMGTLYCDSRQWSGLCTGCSSTRNQRVERLWRDAFRCFGIVSYYTFKSREEAGLLDKTNPLHLFAPHYVYLPRINVAIESFMEAWNKHPMRTECSWSPEQIWTNGMIDRVNGRPPAVAAVRDDGGNYCTLIEKRSSGWLESWEGLLLVTDVSTTCLQSHLQSQVVVLVENSFQTFQTFERCLY